MERFSTERGQGLVEYALIFVLVAIVVISALTLVGTKTSAIFTDLNNELTSLHPIYRIL